MSETKKAAQEQEGTAAKHTKKANVNGLKKIEPLFAQADHRPQPGDPPGDGSNDGGETSSA
jgi:hypothetical protein